MFNRTITVKVEFPALDALVEYLKQRDNQQAEIDRLSSQVAQATGALKQSTASLSEAVTKEQ